MILKKDCLHFKSDRPCYIHKGKGEICDKCNNYSPIRHRILVIKLESLGDVLRTTCILQGLNKKYPESHVTWVTSVPAVPLLLNNPFIHKVVPLN